MQITLADLTESVAKTDYIADPELMTSLWLMAQLNRPLLLEGEAGFGKTEVAKILATILERTLIRLQCYEGLDINTAVYEWNYQRQLLAIRRLEIQNDKNINEQQLFSDTYLLKRPLLQSITETHPTVLLIDEVDRADEEFEAYLLELLSDFQISIPELGTIKAKNIPRVILTSNGTRELSDALRRRCIYHYIDYPSDDKELQIIITKVPNIETQLASQIVRFVHSLRKEGLSKSPGIAETLDWSCALLQLNIKSLDDDVETVIATLGCLLKTRDDFVAIPPELTRSLVAKAV